MANQVCSVKKCIKNRAGQHQYTFWLILMSAGSYVHDGQIRGLCRVCVQWKKTSKRVLKSGSFGTERCFCGQVLDFLARG